ncbi:MAG: YdbC family protein [Lachnospiraceae bacterium]
MPDIKYEILETLIVFPESGGYHKELNLIKWNNRTEPKYDLRGWTADREKMTKGVTLTKDELEFLQAELFNIKL